MVRPPQNPVVISNFQVGSRCVMRVKIAIARPMIKPPIRLTISVPSGMWAFSGFIFMLTAQRKTLPTPPPINTASKELNMGQLPFNQRNSRGSERDRRNATRLSPRGYVDIISL
ncbi:Uncharacterised protein [Serratia marcescens]|uniref:Uncharacterized protein n=1 Tax=Serratia marcescens TaxID=615 RepID=A0A380AN41_SERMA|nr:Uncharacterised protein [Serratia marcescens]